MDQGDGRLYYQIQLTARQLTLALIGVAVLCVVSFVLGYAAASAVIGEAESGGTEPAGIGVAPSPIAVEVAEALPVTPSVEPTPSPTPKPAATTTPTHRPKPTATPTPKPTVAEAPPPVREGFWVQVIAVSEPDSLDKVRSRMTELGFPEDHQWLVRSADGRGGTIYKLRVGPLPDRTSGDRVARKMKVSGYPGAWVVVP